MDEVRARWVVDPEESLPAVENVARLSIKLCVRASLKPGRVVEVRTHELKREDSYANHDEQ